MRNSHHISKWYLSQKYASFLNNFPFYRHQENCLWPIIKFSEVYWTAKNLINLSLRGLLQSVQCDVHVFLELRSHCKRDVSKHRQNLRLHWSVHRVVLERVKHAKLTPFAKDTRFRLLSVLHMWHKSWQHNQHNEDCAEEMSPVLLSVTYTKLKATRDQKPNSITVFIQAAFQVTETILPAWKPQSFPQVTTAECANLQNLLQDCWAASPWFHPSRAESCCPGLCRCRRSLRLQLGKPASKSQEHLRQNLNEINETVKSSNQEKDKLHNCPGLLTGKADRPSPKYDGLLSVLGFDENMWTNIPDDLQSFSIRMTGTV